MNLEIVKKLLMIVGDNRLPLSCLDKYSFYDGRLIIEGRLSPYISFHIGIEFGEEDKFNRLCISFKVHGYYKFQREKDARSSASLMNRANLENGNVVDKYRCQEFKKLNLMSDLGTGRIEVKPVESMLMPSEAGSCDAFRLAVVHIVYRLLKKEVETHDEQTIARLCETLLCDFGSHVENVDGTRLHEENYQMELILNTLQSYHENNG